MNTCAECRFWKEPSRVDPLFMRGRDGQWNECTRAGDNDARFDVAIVCGCREEEAVMTRSDFGCVQFEQRPADVTVERVRIQARSIIASGNT